MARGFREEDTILNGIEIIGGMAVNGRNTSARVAVCLCLDASGSMTGHPINELNAGVRMFYDAVRKDDTACSAVDISIVTFSGNREVKCIQGFSQVFEISTPPSLTASGMTPMGEAVNFALDLLEARKKEYQKSALEYYQPWLVLMSDGQPNGDQNTYNRAVERVRNMVNTKKLTIFAIGIGNEASREALSQFSPKRPPVKLKGLDFKKFFEWLSQSAHNISVSKLGENVKLPPIDNWAEPWGIL